jgi:cytochrome c biogenesis protein CcmG/thiol:disulfide interchange protein DsbE
MKKTLLIVAVVAALIGATIFLDRTTRKGGAPEVKAASAATATPVMSLKDLRGNDVTLADYRGKVVLVNFWATWCEPCRIEIPWLIEFQKKYGPRGFTVLGVAMDDEGKKVVKPYVQKERFDVGGQQEAMNYPILIGNDAAVEKFGGLIGYPTSVLISRDGRQVKKILGLVDHDRIAKDIEGQL